MTVNLIDIFVEQHKLTSLEKEIMTLYYQEKVISKVDVTIEGIAITIFFKRGQTKEDGFSNPFLMESHRVYAAPDSEEIQELFKRSLRSSEARPDEYQFPGGMSFNVHFFPTEEAITKRLYGEVGCNLI